MTMVRFQGKRHFFLFSFSSSFFFWKDSLVFYSGSRPIKGGQKVLGQIIVGLMGQGIFSAYN